MKKWFFIFVPAFALVTLGLFCASMPALAGPATTAIQSDKRITITMFCIFILITLGIVYWAAKRTSTTRDYYIAAGIVTGTQNGWALAGDFMSAASFLGVAGLVALFGYDGMMYAIGTSFAYVTVLLVVAEPCRNVGRFTVGDILSFRASPKPVRATMAFAAVLLSIMYLVVQMVGGGKLMELLLGIPYTWAVIGVGVLMTVYVVFGGMIATTWVQIIKAGLLLSGAIILFLLMASKFGFNPLRLFSEVSTSKNIQAWVQVNLLKEITAQPGFEYGQRFLEPGLLLKDAWDQVSLGIAFLLGTAGMPHILMRFFTVPDARAARKSVVIAMVIISTFFIMITMIGLAAAVIVSPQAIFSVDRGGNMANLLLAQLLGAEISPIFGDVLLGFLCAVAFATILAVVSGLVLASSGAIAHDIWVSIVRNGKATQHEQVTAARITALLVAIVAIIIAVVSETVNVAHLATLAFAIASSGVVPAVVFSLFWRKMSTTSICATLLIATILSL
ncbi:MAG: cation acetate symporter, partial [Deltaproteobacteria bacterium]|nr:cation acetate symporter [Deltaproteobacteria bacterium]